MVFEDTDVSKIRQSIFVLSFTSLALWLFAPKTIHFLKENVDTNGITVDVWKVQIGLFFALLYLSVRYILNYRADAMQDGGVTAEREKLVKLTESYGKPAKELLEVLTGRVHGDRIREFIIEFGASGPEVPVSLAPVDQIEALGSELRHLFQEHVDLLSEWQNRQDKIVVPDDGTRKGRLPEYPPRLTEAGGKISSSAEEVRRKAGKLVELIKGYTSTQERLSELQERFNRGLASATWQAEEIVRTMEHLTEQLGKVEKVRSLRSIDARWVAAAATAAMAAGGILASLPGLAIAGCLIFQKIYS
jgi:hypothetical protein